MPVALRYSITIAIILAIVSARVTSDGGGPERYPFLVFIPVILACGALLDRGNGFLATALSTALIDYYMLPPLGSMAVVSGEDQAALALFFFTGVLISLVVEALHVGLVDLTTEHETAQAAVNDRELLLNELAHRTRNDFANIVTLLNLQSRSAGEGVREALVSAADRVQTIARVHRQLELRDDHVVVDTKSYIGDLCADLRLSRLAMRPVGIECNAESHSISLEKAVPLGLIINESITNAAKHAFPDGRQGIIKVTFERAGDVYKLTVADNGIGQTGKPRDGGLGNQLVQMLAAQLGSKVEVQPRAPGTAVVVTIVVKTAKYHGPG